MRAEFGLHVERVLRTLCVLHNASAGRAALILSTKMTSIGDEVRLACMSLCLSAPAVVYVTNRCYMRVLSVCFCPASRASRILMLLPRGTVSIG